MMSVNPPSYVTLPSAAPIPSYTAEPRTDEHRLVSQRPSGVFVKVSKSGGFSLRLTGQEENVSQPVYGCGSTIDGTVDVSKPDGISSVEVKIEGKLVLREIAEGGSATSSICLSTALLWVKDRTSNKSSPCPASLPFCLVLPSTFTAAVGTVYPLPPTYEAHLSGLPGFQANILYSVSVLVTKPKSALFGIVNGQTVLSMPFLYNPRSRPAMPLPRPLTVTRDGIFPTPKWRLFESSLRSKSKNCRDINVQLYLPRSQIFCLKETIPFHLVFKSTAQSLAASIPYGPNVNGMSFPKRPMQLQLLRKCTVDVRHNKNALELDIKTDIWRVDSIGEGFFVRSGDGPRWVAYSGELIISDEVKVGGFRASGLTVRDFIVLSMYPSEPAKALFKELRQVIPVRLTSDPWTPDGSGRAGVVVNGFGSSECSLSFADRADDEHPEVFYAQ